MSVEPIGILSIIAGVVAILFGPYASIGLFVCATVLGSASVASLPGGGNLSPAHLLLMYAIFALLVFDRKRPNWINYVAFPRPGFWLGILVLYGFVSAYYFPRLFSGTTYINAIGSTEYGPNVSLVPLVPTSGNITQSAYLLADFVCFVAVSAFLCTKERLDYACRLIVAFSVLDIIGAIADIATGLTGTSFLLEPIRNATYQLHVDETAGGLRRITGLFVEASSFSYVTIGCFSFNFYLWLSNHQLKICGLISLVLFILLLLSTSSTARFLKRSQ